MVAVETVLSRNRATEGPERQRSRRVKGRKKKKQSACSKEKKAGEETAAESHIRCGDLAATLQQPSSNLAATEQVEMKHDDDNKGSRETQRELTPFNGCLFGGLAGRRRQQMGAKDKHRRHHLTGNGQRRRRLFPRFGTSTSRLCVGPTLVSAACCTLQEAAQG